MAIPVGARPIVHAVYAKTDKAGLVNEAHIMFQ